jgi:thiosulfate reductase cytochrome b subunit
MSLSNTPASRLAAEAINLPHSMTTSTIPMNAPIGATIHPAWMRTSHWLNALAVVLMVTSGWRIYNAVL